MIGIVSYGVTIPRNRIKTSEIAKVWGKNFKDIESSLGVIEKAVQGIDEDSATLAVEAGKRALSYAGIPPEKIGAVFVGSESHPYAVNPTSTIVSQFLGVGHNCFAADMEFACKAATTAIQVISGLLDSNRIVYGMAVGSDTAQAKPHDILEYTAGTAGAAYILGQNVKEILAEIVDFASYSSDTPDFWRRDGIAYPSHSGRFTGEPAYFSHVIGSSRLLLDRLEMNPSDFAYCVFHMPNGKFPEVVAKRLGFSKEQLKPSYIVPRIGNPYSASSLVGLAAVLDEANVGDLIFMTSYGSGAGADSFVFRVHKKCKPTENLTVKKLISKKRYVSYAQYLKMTRKI